jgi:hypothetical protein
MKKISLFLIDFSFKLIVLFLLVSCSKSAEEEFVSIIKGKYDFHTNSKSSSEVFLFLDLRSCGACLDEILNTLKDDKYGAALNVIFIKGQNMKFVSENLSPKMEKILLIDEDEFIEINGGYGFFIYLFEDQKLLKSFQINNLNAREMLSLNFEFFINDNFFIL